MKPIRQADAIDILIDHLYNAVDYTLTENDLTYDQIVAGLEYVKVTYVEEWLGKE